MAVRRPLPAYLAASIPAAARSAQGLPALKRAVVTGPTGGVGVNLINELTAHGVAVYAVHRPDSPRVGNLPVHPLVTAVPCALDSFPALPERIDVPCDAFFHLAWDGAYGAARNDASLQQRNVGAALDAVRAADALGCAVFVGAGSQSEFGRVSGVLSPDLPCRPDTEYGKAKLAACKQSSALCGARGLRHSWCRILSLYGPFDGAHTMVMALISQLLAGKRPQCTAGEQIWDYIYAKDAARAFRLVAERGRPGAVYCVGSGKPRLLKDYIRAIRDAIDPALPVGFGELPYYPHQVMRLEADITSLTADTGFAPQYSFEAGIGETVAWMRARMAETGDSPT